jgi:hypothetical protein
LNNINKIRLQIIKENNVNIRHCFLFNLNADFQIKPFVNSLQQISFPLNQVYCFSSNIKIRREIKKYFLPSWDFIFADKEQNEFILLQDKSDKKQKIKIKVKKFKTFLAKYKKLFYIKDNYYIYIDSCGITYQILKGFEDEIENISMIEMYTEQYPKYFNQVTQDIIFNFLSYHNFSMKYIIEKTINPCQKKSIWIKN